MVKAVLIGPPGAGKSTIGRLLAQRWDAEIVDTDALIEQEQGRTISDIFVEDGEATFRVLEADAVRRAVTGTDAVVALGGGAPMQESVQQVLVDQPVVFLDVAIADAAGRVGFDRSRPLLAVNPRAQWKRLMEQRRPTYEKLAAVRVDTAGRTPEQVTDEVAAGLERTHG